MDTINLFAELLANPRSVADYRKLIEQYKICNLNNEAKAFEQLVQRKFNGNSTSTDKEQLRDDPKGS